MPGGHGVGGVLRGGDEGRRRHGERSDGRYDCQTECEIVREV